MCFSLLKCFGITSMQCWLRDDDSATMERRCLELLRDSAASLLDDTAKTIDSRTAPTGPPELCSVVDVAVSAVLPTLAIVYDTVVAHYCDRMPVCSRRVDVDRFFCTYGCPVLSRRPDHCACDSHCAQELLQLGLSALLSYPSNFVDPQDLSALSCVVDPTLRAVLYRLLCSRSLASCVRRCAILSPIPGDLASQVRICIVPYDSVSSYTKSAQAEHASRMLSLVQRVVRQPTCVQCIFSPAVSLLSRYTIGTAPPIVANPPVDVSMLQRDSAVLGESYSHDFVHPRCIVSGLAKEVGPDVTMQAVLWYFGGIANPCEAFIELLCALTGPDVPVQMAVSGLHDIIIDSFRFVSSVGWTTPDASSTKNTIDEHLRRTQLYDARNRIAITALK